MTTQTPNPPAVEEVQRMAVASPFSWDEKTRTFECFISSDNDIGDGVALSHDQGAFRFPPRPVPLTVDHSNKSEDVWGAISELRIERINGSSTLIGRGKVDDIETPAVMLALARLRNGSARFSVRAKIYRIAPPMDRDSARVAVDWEMLETSLVLTGKDPVSIMRASDIPNVPVSPMTTPATSPDPAPVAAETATTEAAAPVAVVERSAVATPPNPPAPAPAPAAPSVEVQRSAAEIRRENEILRAGMNAGLPAEKVDELVRSGKPFNDCVHQIFTLMRDNLSQSGAGHPAHMQVTRTEGDTITRGITDTLGFRLHTIKKPTDFGRKFSRKRSVDLLETYLVSRGINTDDLTVNQIVDRAFHSTSDFPNILADVANKRLLAGYAEDPQTWRGFCSQRNLSDFKPHNNVQLQGRMTLARTLESGEYVGMTMTEGKATWQLATYTGKLLWTRQMIINDDLNAFEKVIMLAGRGARITESDIVWSLLTTGTISAPPAGGGGITGIDGLALFAAGHSNTGTGVIASAGVDAGRVAMRRQKDIAGNELNLTPKFVIVPTSLQTVAEQFFYAPNYTPAAMTGASGPNVFAGKMEVIVDNRMETRSSTNWMMVADPRTIETIEYGYLAGEEGPQVTVTDRRDPDGAEMLVRMDFGAAIQDYRGFYRSTGA